MPGRTYPAPAAALCLLLCLVTPGCKGDDDDATDDDVGDDDVSTAYPQIEIHGPQRASFHDGDPTVNVHGRCIADDAPLSTFTIDGINVTLDDEGRFSHDVPAVDGINVVELQCNDRAGERAVDALAFHFGDTHEPGRDLRTVAVIVASPELLDDDQPDVDDTASLVEEILEDPGTFDDLPSSSFEYFDVTPTSMSLSRAEVDLTPTTGVLDTAIALYDVEVDFTAEGTGIWSWVSVDGTASTSPARVQMDLAVSAVGGNVRVETLSASVDLGGFDLSVDYVPDFLEPYLSSYLRSYVEDEICGVAEEMVAEFLAGYLDSFALEFDFLDPDPITIAVELETIEVGGHGITFELGGRASSPTVIDLPAGAGSLNTAGSPPSVPFSTSPISVAVDDDLVNQLLFAVWAAGHTRWTFSADDLAAMGGEDIPEPLGPVQSAQVEIQLPMVMTPTTSSDFAFDMGIGEVWTDQTRTDGEVLGFTISVIGGAAVAQAEDGSMKMTMEDRASQLTLGVGVLDCPEGQVPANMAALVELVVPPMLGQANEALPGFPFPEVDLGSLADIGYFQGKAMTFHDPQIGTAGGDGLWVLLEGRMAVE